jgi:hypothetical protein
VIYTTHSHSDGGAEVPRTHQEQIERCIAAMVSPVRRGAAPQMRDEFSAALAAAGWSGEVSVSPPESAMTITSKKAHTGLCLQTGGNMSRIYADLLKLQALYLNNVIRCGVFVLPSAHAAKILGDNIAQADRLIRELAIFRKVVTIPLLVYSVES